MFCWSFFVPFISGDLNLAAVSVSNDVKIRKVIRNSIEKESELIGDIGDAELDMKFIGEIRRLE